MSSLLRLAKIAASLDAAGQYALADTLTALLQRVAHCGHCADDFMKGDPQPKEAAAQPFTSKEKSRIVKWRVKNHAT